MYETTIKLNSSEIGILLSSLQLVETSQEHQIAKEYGSLPTLYDKLYTEWKKLKKDAFEYDHKEYAEASY